MTLQTHEAPRDEVETGVVRHAELGSDFEASQDSSQKMFPSKYQMELLNKLNDLIINCYLLQDV